LRTSRFASVCGAKTGYFSFEFYEILNIVVVAFQRDHFLNVVSQIILRNVAYDVHTYIQLCTYTHI